MFTHPFPSHLLAALVATAFLAAGALMRESPVMVPGFLLLAGIAVHHLWLIVHDRFRYWSLCDLHGAALLFWYCGGAAAGLVGGDGVELGMVDGADFEALFLASLFVILSCLAIFLLAPLERPFWRPVLLCTQRATGLSSLAVGVTAALWLVMLQLVRDGDISFRTMGQEGSGADLPVLALLVLQMSLPLVGFFGWLWGRRRGGMPLFFLSLAFLPLIGLVLLGLGRRPLLAHLVTFLVFFAWGREWRATWRQSLLALAILLPLVAAGSLIFQSERHVAAAEAQLGVERTMVEHVSRTVPRLQDEWERVWENQQESLPERLFMIRYLKELIGSPVEAEFARGDDTLGQMVSAVPRFLLDEKQEILHHLGGVGPERNAAFGLTTDLDWPDSLLAAGYREMGWGGVLVSAVLLLSFGILFASVLRPMGGPFFSLLFLGALLVEFQIAEMSFVSQAMNLFRLMIILLPLAVAEGLLARRS